MTSLTKLLRGFVCIVIIFMFMFTGLFVSLLSALIECSVFIEIFKTDLIDIRIISIFSCCMAIGFEVVKNFSNIVIPIITLINNPNNSLKKFNNSIKKSRKILVAISLLCTLIFTSNALIKTTSSINEKNKALQEITTELKYEEEKIQKDINNDYNNELRTLNTNINKTKEKLNNATINFGTRSTVYKHFKNELNEAQKLLNEFKKYGYQEITNSKDYQKRLDNAKNKFNDDKKSIEGNQNITLQRSVYLSNFINIIGLDSHNQNYYILTVVLISLIISITIEIVISIVSSFLSTNANAIFEELDRQVKLSIEEVKKIKHMIKSIYSAGLCLAIYLIIMQSKDQPIIAKSIIIIFFTYLVSNKITMITSNNDVSFHNKLKEILTNGLIAFAGYFIFGIFFGDNYTDLSSIAVTLGAVIGQYLNLNLPIPFFKKPNQKSL